MKSLKKIAFYSLILIAVIYGYEYVTGESLSTLPKKIVNALYHPEIRTKSANPHYYEDPAKNMK